MKKKLTLISYNPLPTSRDAIEFLYKFTLVDSSLVGEPEEDFNTSTHQIKIAITGGKQAAWLYRQPDLDFLKVAYEFGKRELIQKIKDGTITDYQELIITSVNSPEICPYNSKKIKLAKGLSTEFEVEGKIMEDNSLIQIASSILSNRDFINALIKEKHKEKLFVLVEERDLLQLFRNANSEEEFVFRITAFQLLITRLNEPLLRELTSISDTKIKSISLLENYLKSYKKYDKEIIKFFRNINRLRQLYPIHGDNADGVLEAHRSLGIDYPVRNYSEAWKKVLMIYDDSLKRILEIIRVI